jgi:dTDP-4-amino-4,6-dideoxygalactose transaminase
MIGRIPATDLGRQYATIRGEVEEALRRVFDSGSFVLGEEGRRLEEEFARYCGVRYGVGVNSGTDALTIALRAIGVGAGDEVITVPNTAIPTAAAIRNAGATPTFVDVREDSYLIDVDKLEAAITPRTKAVIPVHLYGRACEMGRVGAIAKEKGLFVLEDCAQAHGATHQGKRVGSLGDAACFSFYPTKNLGAFGDAGMIVTDDERIAESSRRLREYGQETRGEALADGYNSRLDEMQAAILRAKLARLDGWNAQRRQIAERYHNEIVNDRVVLPAPGSGTHVFHLFVARCRQRDALRAHLDRGQIGTAIHYPIPLHLHRAYLPLGYRRGDFPVAERLAEEIVTLPLFPEMQPEEVRYVIERVNDFEAR